jgi:tRNA(Met) cytidine acetyltransferase
MTLIRQHQPLPAVVRSADSSLTPPDNPDRIGTDDQDRAIAAIMKVATGHRRRPLVITANRGRGKSSAFGIAAAKLLLLDYGHILVTGPQFTAVQPIFEHARRLLPQARIAGPVLHYAGKTMEFVAPDELLRTEKKTDLLLVDEAAAIPAYLLEQLLDRYARIAFATTIHGYEGSGRGFSLRFNKILDRRTPGWKSLQLEQPIRWAADDPLEHFLFRTLLLDAAPAADTAVARVQPEDCVIEQLDRDRLVEDETMLAQLFGLLVLAHYRTRPYDLRHLLDGPNLEIYVMRYRGNILATALVAIEGQLDSNITQDIYRGYRRLQGHLIPQMLIAQLGLPEAANMTGARIMRIAVHPLLQRRGFGTHLINHIDKRMQQNNYDWIGSSFGATPELLNFWIRLGQLPVRLGFTREASSGAHSLLMLKPFSDTAAGLCQRARVRFLDSLPYLLADPLSDFDPELTAPLLADSAANADPSMLSVSEWSEIEAFAFHQRNYQDSLRAIHKLTVMALRTPDIAGILKPQQQIALIGRVLQKRSWQDIAGLTEVSGRAQVIALLQQTFRIIHAYFHPDTSGG